MITLVFANRVTISESGLVDQVKDFPGFYPKRDDQSAGSMTLFRKRKD